MYASSAKDTSSSTGDTNLTLDNPSNNLFDNFNVAYGTNNYFAYRINHDSADEWEEGIGHLSAATTLVRDIVHNNSSGSTAKISFSSGGLTLIGTPLASTIPNPVVHPFNHPNNQSGPMLINEWQTGYNSTTPMALTANRIYATPFYTSVGMICDEAYINVTTGAASTNVKIAGYRTDNAGDADRRIFSVQSSPISTATAGTKTGAFDGGAQPIPPGDYLILTVSDGTPSLRCIIVTEITQQHWLGYDTNLLLSRGLYASGSYSTGLANPLPATTWVRSSSNHHPVVGLGHS